MTVTGTARVTVDTYAFFQGRGITDITELTALGDIFGLMGNARELRWIQQIAEQEGMDASTLHSMLEARFTELGAQTMTFWGHLPIDAIVAVYFPEPADFIRHDITDPEENT